MRIVLFDFTEQASYRLAHGTGSLGTAARGDRRAERFRKTRGDVFRHKSQRTNQPEVLFARVSDGRQGAHTAGKHGISKERLAKVVGGMAKRDHVGPQTLGDLIDRATPEAAAQVAAMIGLLFEQ